MKNQAEAMGHVVHIEQGVDAGRQGNHGAGQVDGGAKGNTEFPNLASDAHLLVAFHIDGNGGGGRLGAHGGKVGREHLREGLEGIALGRCTGHEEHGEDVDQVQNQNAAEDPDKDGKNSKDTSGVSHVGEVTENEEGKQRNNCLGQDQINHFVKFVNELVEGFAAVSLAQNRHAKAHHKGEDQGACHVDGRFQRDLKESA